MASNIILSAFAPALMAALAKIKEALSNIASNPTVENVVSQGEAVIVNAINPAQLEGASIGALAQEAANVIAAFEAHINSATTAPTATKPAA